MQCPYKIIINFYTPSCFWLKCNFIIFYVHIKIINNSVQGMQKWLVKLKSFPRLKHVYLLIQLNFDNTMVSKITWYWIYFLSFQRYSKSPSISDLLMKIIIFISFGQGSLEGLSSRKIFKFHSSYKNICELT